MKTIVKGIRTQSKKSDSYNVVINLPKRFGDKGKTFEFNLGTVYGLNNAIELRDKAEAIKTKYFGYGQEDDCIYYLTKLKEEVKKPELNAKLVAENIGFQLGKRMNFRRAVKMALQSTMNAGAKGVRIEVAGRLNGAEMSRREKFIEGSVPLHTLRADIDFYCHHAPTIAGIVGVKVWIYKGEK